MNTDSFTTDPVKNYRTKHLMVCIVFILLACISYGRVVTFDFISFDDNEYVYDNPYVKHGLTEKGLIKAFSFSQKGDHTYWHPLTFMSHMLDCQVFGLNPHFHHLTNLLFHLTSTILLYFLFYQMTRQFWSSILIALFFLLHPVNVESVAWIAERKNVLSTCLMLLTLLFYQFYALKDKKTSRLICYVVSFFWFILGLLSKPMIVTVPCIFLLLDLWPLKRVTFFERDQFCIPWKNLFKLIVEKLPFFVLSAAASVISRISIQNIQARISLEQVPMSLRVLNALNSYVLYLKKLIWPFDLAVFYPFPKSLPIYPSVLAAIFLIAVTVLAVYWINRKPYILVGWLWYLGTLFPVIGLMQNGRWPAMADRWAYVPMIGIYMILAQSIEQLFQRYHFKQYARFLLVSILSGTLLIITCHQVGFWKNNFSLYRRALDVTRNNHMAHYNLGVALMDAGKEKAAVTEFKKALAIDPTRPEANFNLGNIYQKHGKFELAQQYYQKELQLKPTNAKAQYNLGTALSAQGNYTLAIEHFHKAIDSDPDYFRAYYNMAIAYEALGKTNEAVEQYLYLIKKEPDFGKAYFNLGSLYLKSGQFDLAISRFKQSATLLSDLASVNNNLGVAYLKKNQLRLAIGEFKKALAKDPQNQDAAINLKRNNAILNQIETEISRVQTEIKHENDRNRGRLYYKLASLYYREGDNSKALDSVTIALKELPGYEKALMLKSMICIAQNDLEKAIETLKVLIVKQPDNPNHYYNIGCLYGRQNDTQACIDWLNQAFEHGYTNWEAISKDPDLDQVRKTPAFEQFIQRRRQ